MFRRYLLWLTLVVLLAIAAACSANNPAPQTAPPGLGPAQRGHASQSTGRSRSHPAQNSASPLEAEQRTQSCASRVRRNPRGNRGDVRDTI